MAGGSASLSATARLHSAFSKSLNHRCSEVAKILDETSNKEMHGLLPTLLESIFGFGNQPGWGVGWLSRGHLGDFHAMRQFLHPAGPLLQLVQRLSGDSYYRYEFPLSCIPYPSQQLIEDGLVPPLYTDKLQLNQVAKPYNMLSLNAFEYYFFHFCYFLVSTHSQKPSRWSNPSDALFPVVFEEYLNFFLPLDERKSQATSLSSPMTPNNMTNTNRCLQSPLSRLQDKNREYHSPLGRLGDLLHLPVSPSSPAANRSYASPSTPSSPHPENTYQHIQRSQLLLQIIIEFWLHQTVGGSPLDKYSPGHSYLGQPGLHSNVKWASHTSYDPYLYMVQESFLPSSDHVRVMRMLVKHLHYFVNSSKPDIISSPYSPAVISPWEEFKRSVFPHMVQKKLYMFLKHGFEKWPLDSSFRLMLETWLSFIQPWRYTNPTQSNRERESESKDFLVDEKWSQFVVDSLLFYTALFHSFLKRVFKMDLTASKNAYMLFRVTKVFNLSNLKEMIEEAENSFDTSPRMSHNYQTHTADLGASYLSSSHRHHSNMASILSMQFAELEGVNYHYQFFFCEDTSRTVQSLLSLLGQARRTLTSVGIRGAGNDSTSGLLGWGNLGSLFDSQSADNYDEYGATDNKKLTSHLEQSISNLCNVFQLDAPEKDKNVTWGSIQRYQGGPPENLVPDVYNTDEGAKLSPLGRYQLMNGLRKFEIEYQGDPDLQPIRSFENAFMVRLLHSVTSYVNHKFGDDIQRLYKRNSFIGKLSRQIFRPPLCSSSPPHQSKLAPFVKTQQGEYQNPRLSMRWMASYQRLGYFIAGYLMLYMWMGITPVTYIILLFLVALVTASIQTFNSPIDSHQHTD